MSIAVSTVIVPSRRLRWLLALVCACMCGAAVAMAVHATRFAWHGAGALAPLLAGLASGMTCLVLPTAATARRIDISGLGQLRLTVQQDMEGAATTMLLLPGATAWPGCLLLRLRDEQGAERPLLLMPDSVSAGEYRALLVAVRALGASALPQQIF